MTESIEGGCLYPSAPQRGTEKIRVCLKKSHREKEIGNLVSCATSALCLKSNEAVRLLWHCLRDGGLAGYEFQCQVVIEPYIVDFVCQEAQLIVESYNGLHIVPMQHDDSRTDQLNAMGYRVIRFGNNAILNEIQYVLKQILLALVEVPLSQRVSQRMSQQMPQQMSRRINFTSKCKVG